MPADTRSMENHNTQTMEPESCPACIARRESDPYAHGRVDGFYARFHLRAVAEDRQAPIQARMEACSRLTHPSMPAETRHSAGMALVRLADVSAGIRKSCE